MIVELWLAGRILPGVYVWDVDLGSLTYDQATARLATEFHYPADRTPVLRYEDQAWPVNPQDLGTELNLPATADAALAVGHQGKLLTRMPLTVRTRTSRLMRAVAGDGGSHLALTALGDISLE